MQNCLAFLKGSSPRGRGKRSSLRPRRPPTGLIPAWAGKTPGSHSTGLSVWAHPRVGGENIIGVVSSRRAAGSSPRGRGKHHQRAEATARLGLIPAWAGKTNRLGARSRRSWAHPRVGGENFGNKANDESADGSSPRGRGKRVPRAPRDDRDGLIPAWAGKTPGDPTGEQCSWAHPRVGGENEVRSSRSRLITGSSPRGRGKRVLPGFAPAWRGLIPAWAGKTSCHVVLLSVAGAHPRVGGENSSRMGRRLATGGSSPRGRGKHGEHHPAEVGVGLIPAWAGKTRLLPDQRRGRWAHPRVGGENSSNTEPSRPRGGSSPRGRGKPSTHRRRVSRSRLIPAWAGKT